MITGRTRVVGVIGDPVAHSRSPAMHMAAFRHLNLDWVYVPLHVTPPNLSRAMAGVRALGMEGVNVTVPHKVTVMPFLDEIDEAARLIGAVNTVVHRDGRLIGYNTDGDGFLRSLRVKGHDVKGKRLLLLGAGGAALAIATAAALAGARSIAVANRTVANGEAIVDVVSPLLPSPGARAVPLPDRSDGLSGAPESFVDAAAEADIVVQCTSVGMWPHHEQPPVVDPEFFRTDALCVDIVYTPLMTEFLKRAEARGCPVVTGEGMLVYQGAIALELWTARRAPEQVMLQALLNQLE